MVCAGDPPLGVNADNRDAYGTIYTLRAPVPASWPAPLAACAEQDTGLCSSQALLGYETLMLLAQAAEDAGTLVPEKVGRLPSTHHLRPVPDRDQQL